MNNDLQIDCFNSDNINIHEYYEVEHWAKELDTNVEALKIAVEHVGASVKDVKQYLNK